ncbi:hypothetical protein [Actinospica robiniae]|uniref:hypothetical protein n=1 Tax=Actinospica robiniae TaxID=304901 RepID=UPI00040D863D|nr:hypothetical protein [Actinospica robiniae]
MARYFPRRVLTCVLLVAAVFAALQALDYHKDVPSNDTYQYTKQTLRILGHSQAQAVHEATVMYCEDGGPITSSATAPLTAGECLRMYRDGLTPDKPRYLAIFTSRPGYPLLAAPLAAAFGLRFALWAAALLCTLLASVVVLALLRAAGCGWRAAAAGQALFLLAPTGYWGSRMLSDGPSLATVLLTLLGAVWMAKGRIRAGGIVFAAGLFTGFVVRYSSEQFAVLLIALGAVLCLWRVRDGRTGGVKALAIAAGAGFVVSEAASALLGWPGLSASLQDTFTRHFERPDVSDPLFRLLKSDLHFWFYFPVYASTDLLTAAVLVVLAVLLVRRHTVYGVLVIATAATGLGAVLVHPVASQADRLMAPVWLVLALGLPPLVDRFLRHRPERLREPQASASPVPLNAGTMGEKAL